MAPPRSHLSRLVARTPARAFTATGLPDFPYRSRYVEIDDEVIGPGSLRVHYVDEGPPDADPVLLVHGQPTWSYLYRHVVRELVARGHRVVAADNVGYGRSDKPIDRFHYTYQRHVDWHRAVVAALDLRRITVVGQDWGGPIGFGALAANPDRYDRAVATNTILHCADPAFAGRLAWANHGVDDGRVLLEERLVEHALRGVREAEIDVRAAIARGVGAAPLPPAALDAYAAPFPDERHRAGLRQMNALIPLTRGDPGAEVSRRTWAALAQWTKPFLVAWGELDAATRGFDDLFAERVPGAQRVHIPGAGHFVQEDQPVALAEAISAFAAGP